jgi:chromosome segregation ATPase
MANWHQEMASYEGRIRDLEAQIQDLQSKNEGLQKQVADAAVTLEAHQNQSRNRACEFERQVKAAHKERDLARARQKESDDETERSAIKLKKMCEARDLARMKADKLEAQVNRDLTLLLQVHGWLVPAMRKLALDPTELLSRDIAGVTSFVSNLAGQLETLSTVLEVRARQEGVQLVDALARFVLPRIYRLAPDFPFDKLLDSFASDEERDAAITAVTSFIDQLKSAAKRE